MGKMREIDLGPLVDAGILHLIPTHGCDCAGCCAAFEHAAIQARAIADRIDHDIMVSMLNEPQSDA